MSHLRDQICLWQPLRSAASSVICLHHFMSFVSGFITTPVFLCSTAEACFICFLWVSFILTNFSWGEPDVFPSNSLPIQMSPVIRYNLLRLPPVLIKCQPITMMSETRVQYKLVPESAKFERVCQIQNCILEEYVNNCSQQGTIECS